MIRHSQFKVYVEKWLFDRKANRALKLFDVKSVIAAVVRKTWVE